MELKTKNGAPKYQTKPKVTAVFHDGAAELIGVSYVTWVRMCNDPARPPGSSRTAVPLPDDFEVVAGAARPWWYIGRLNAWNAERPGRGVGGGTPAHKSKRRPKVAP